MVRMQAQNVKCPLVVEHRKLYVAFLMSPQYRVQIYVVVYGILQPDPEPER